MICLCIESVCLLKHADKCGKSKTADLHIPAAEYRNIWMKIEKEDRVKEITRWLGPDFLFVGLHGVESVWWLAKEKEIVS